MSSTELFNSTLGINETDVRSETDIQVLKDWEFEVKKDIININKKYDRHANEKLLHPEQNKDEAAIIAHKSLYALKRQKLFLELIQNRIEYLNEVKNNTEANV